MQIVQVGKLSQSQRRVEIRGKTFRGCVVHAMPY